MKKQHKAIKVPLYTAIVDSIHSFAHAGTVLNISEDGVRYSICKECQSSENEANPGDHLTLYFSFPYKLHCLICSKGLIVSKEIYKQHIDISVSFTSLLDGDRKLIRDYVLHMTDKFPFLTA